MSVVKGLPRDGTAGEIRQAHLKGWAETGLFSVEAVYKMAVTDPYAYLDKMEPGGKVMSKVEEVVENLGEAAKAITKAGGHVRDTANQTIALITDNNRKLRDNNTKLTDSINVFLKTANKPEYIKAINDMERLATALEKIAELEKNGILNKLAAVIK
jgi:molybdopterin converting factor small subunit